MTERLYPELTRAALLARAAALQRFARWEASHQAPLSASAAIAGIAALYELLPREDRSRPPDPTGVRTLHALMARVAAGR